MSTHVAKPTVIQLSQKNSGRIIKILCSRYKLVATRH